MSDIRFTVFTPIYNRRHTIHRAFDSLMRQSCKDFEWLVIDDGSTDNVKEVIDDYAAQADFPVRYYYKENGGKHTASNMAYGLMTTPYFTVLDSDDALTDDAVEKMLAAWDAIPPADREQYWCIVGHCLNVYTQSIIGEPFPPNANAQTEPVHTVGDKTAALRTEIARQYPFPEPDGTTFVTESVVWNRIDRDYRQYYINDFYKIVYPNEPDSLTATWFRDHVQEGYVSNFIWKQSVLNDVGIHNVKEIYTLFQYVFYGVTAKKKLREIVRGLEKPAYRIAAVLLYPPAKAARGWRRLRGGVGTDNPKNV